MGKVISLEPELKIEAAVKRLMRSAEQAVRAETRHPSNTFYQVLSNLNRLFIKSPIVGQADSVQVFEYMMNTYEHIIFELLNNYCDKNSAYQFIEIFRTNIARRISGINQKEDKLK